MRENPLNPLVTIQQRQAPLARRVLGLFVAVWLTMALQPCAMAFGDVNDDGCLHCPAAHSEEISSHSAHAADQPELSALPYETDASQCGFASDFNYDGRVLKVKDSPTDVPTNIVPSLAVIPLEKNLPALPDIADSSCLPGDPQRLNVFYCVYLI